MEEMLENKIPYPDPDNQVQNDMHSVAFQVPEYVYIPNREEVKVGWWDFETKKWRFGPEFIEKVELDSNNML